MHYSPQYRSLSSSNVRASSLRSEQRVGLCGAVEKWQAGLQVPSYTQGKKSSTTGGEGEVEVGQVVHHLSGGRHGHRMDVLCIVRCLA